MLPRCWSAVIEKLWSVDVWGTGTLVGWMARVEVGGTLEAAVLLGMDKVRLRDGLPRSDIWCRLTL